MKGKNLEKWGYRIMKVGTLAIGSCFGLGIYQGFTFDSNAESRYHQVIASSMKLSECQSQNGDCIELQQEYNALVTQDDTARLLVNYEKESKDSDIFMPLLSLSLFVQLGGRIMRSSGQKDQLEDKLIEAEKKLAEKQ